MPEQTRQYRRRNPVAQATILRKGGVHEKSRKSKRQKQKQELRKNVSKAMATFRGHSFIWNLRKDLIRLSLTNHINIHTC